MKDIKLMINFIEELSSVVCEKEVFFYDFDANVWYSREHADDVSLEDIIEWLRDTVYPYLHEE